MSTRPHLPTPGVAMSNLVDKPLGHRQPRSSLTELTPPAKLHRHHLPAPHHHNDRAQSTASAPLLTRHSIEVPLSEDVTAIMSPDQSVQEPREGDGVAEDMLRLELDKASIRAASLRQSLSNLDALSANMIKQFDDTYYAVLEKTSTLHNTVMAVKELAETSRNISHTFDKTSRILEKDIISQLTAVGDFENEQANISRLQSRVHRVRVASQRLTDRVDAVRERIEGWERADRAWQERTRRRLKIIWSVTSVMAILVIVLALSVNYYTSTTPDGVGRGFPQAAASPQRGGLDTMYHSRPSAHDGRGALLWEARLDKDKPLKVFDDL